MIDSILSLIAPHYCCGCQKIGVLLCVECKYNITSEPFGGCINCAKPFSAQTGVCGRCKTPYSRAWCVGQRKDELETLLNAYKFENARATYKTLADLLDAVLPQLPSSTIIVPVPTIPSHVRQRGYDHTALIARELARRRSLPYSSCVVRVTNSVQRGRGRRERVTQAKQAFSCRSNQVKAETYLLVDDVVTTGSTMRYAARALIKAGARDVWVASISRQPLD